uniref:prolipoprotein diacylglyceryl transferase family protein n=1 Tax=Marinobacter sp. TaxID=50741 RepID=UPI0035C69DEA
VMVLVGVLVAGWWLGRRFKQIGLEQEGALDKFVFWVLVSGFVGARLTYVAVHPEVYENIVSLVAVWKGGIVSYGGFFGGAVSVFDPEFTSTWELALRTQWLHGDLRAHLNLFTTDWKDQQVLVGDSVSFYTITTNAGESHLYGAEAELLWRIAEHWEGFTALGWLETEFEEFVNEDQDFAGNECPYA